MRKGRRDEADAICVRVRKLIIDFNSVSLKGVSTRGGAKDLWDKVKKVTGKRKTHCIVSSGC